MSNPIPQLVNISHALQSDTVEKIRRDIKEFHEASQLKPEQVEAINHYISSLKSTFGRFTEDNEHVERQDAGVTSADTQLYSGLKSMYMDYLNQLGSIKREKVLGDEEVSKDKPVDYISEELPYLQPTERKEYIEGLMLNDSTSKNMGKSQGFLDGMINLCVLDSTVTENLRCYVTLLRKVGYTKEELKNLLPKGLALMPSLTPNNAEEKAKEASASKKVPSSMESAPSFSGVTTHPDSTGSSTGTNTTGGGDDEPKKKISFSRYLKKGDGNENGKRKASLMEEDLRPVKKARANGGSELRSILRTTGSSSSSSKKSGNNIKFVDDSYLVTVFGDGLPNDGLQLSPERLKKVLKPFKEGEPREIVHVVEFKDKAAELDIEFDLSPEESDITETKGGPIPCETTAPLKHRLNFANFSPDLGNKPIREAVVVEDSTVKGKGPLIAKAFGKNSLLLRKDRGGLPYKRIPDVTPNDYPPRP
ncbi:hypothetical protein ZYGR_0I01880 [Zygosaccharomyces rouxii]|uniref:ZYRO0C04400p n=2 Tax=Zygosaccharomyces rouxii TaxID=4956 RepID=C5DT05_ZYGRC|nr:uncharacterized protein ZYRO0C04400g [Zygosaccharomyces rouxii]KAH9201895.1 hypothetical protein LQ764DRAFT_89608 [Zygosaccharomyces rouxii]GAV47892.1 hypothetical protein ZYGR_0I01880 [Zygosaccharomyces rouxii]CAR26916.1 ZYRO0C04400p [Zygosaccharomyces rouxii]